ncbi:hypothetical protein HLB44_20680 [Aquincola sp. S2]|uniref:Uncharacterized protein n=1 Tax=Pseudaquabacterium terrae TaxID=2732868 RepID=A0ABX2EL72_9BURK|nr:hypothetical protein [Aquabacterium terrae]NRF69420.1 hypothetical protein [Aquabacterium terrae]
MAGSVDDSIAQMNQAAADNAKLMAASIDCNVKIQTASSTTNTVNGASSAGGEVAKQVGQDIRMAAKAS